MDSININQPHSNLVQDENVLLQAKQQIHPNIQTKSKSNIPVRRNALSIVTNTTKISSSQGGIKNLIKQKVAAAIGNNNASSTTEELRITKSAIKRAASSNSINGNVETFKRSKRIEYEWEDLDEEDFDDPLMVSEYVVEIFEYLYMLEIKTLPLADYLSKQTYITSNMRDQLVDWMNEVHTKFRLLPETFFVAINLMDRFLSREIVQVNKLQLLGTASLFIASKYEEIYSPSVVNFASEGGSTTDEVLAAEKFILEILDFNLSYPNPMNFLRRISKADDYDVNTRTMGKYFLEISIMDHSFIGVKPSLCAAASMYLSRKMLGKHEWNGNLIHYSGDVTESELQPIVQLYMNYLLGPVIHEEFFKKYASKRFLKASIIARQWAKEYARSNNI